MYIYTLYMCVYVHVHVHACAFSLFLSLSSFRQGAGRPAGRKALNTQGSRGGNPPTRYSVLVMARLSCIELMILHVTAEVGRKSKKNLCLDSRMFLIVPNVLQCPALPLNIRPANTWRNFFSPSTYSTPCLRTRLGLIQIQILVNRLFALTLLIRFVIVASDLNRILVVTLLVKLRLQVVLT